MHSATVTTEINTDRQTDPPIAGTRSTQLPCTRFELLMFLAVLFTIILVAVFLIIYSIDDDKEWLSGK